MLGIASDSIVIELHCCNLCTLRIIEPGQILDDLYIDRRYVLDLLSGSE